MGLGEKLLFFWKNRKQIKEASGAVDAIKEAYVKEGYKTTEFWITVVVQLQAVYGVVQGVVPPETGLIISAVLAALYAGLRTYSKAPR